MSTSKLWTSFAAVLLAAASAAAEAGVVDLAPPPATYDGDSFDGSWLPGVGAHRSFVFEDASAFTLNSVGIEINPNGTTTLTARLFNYSGSSTLGSLVATSAPAVVTDLGRGFYDVVFSRVFAGTGDRYLLDIEMAGAPQEATFFGFDTAGEGGANIDSPYIAGPFRVIDGKSATNLNDSNFVIAHFRADVTTATAVPLPPAAWSGLATLGGLALLGLRQRRAQLPV